LCMRQHTRLRVLHGGLVLCIQWSRGMLHSENRKKRIQTRNKHGSFATPTALN
jgi:hypothetical protein